ncbi:MAG: OmpA family protein [Candidatus Kapaibacterium sp.]
MKKLQFYSICLLILSCTTLFTQDSAAINKFGLSGGFNYNLHSADFYKLKDIPNCCPAFESGDGTGFSLGVLYQRKLSDGFWASANLGYSVLNGLLLREESTTINIESGPAPGTFEHRLQGNISNINLDLSVDYNIFQSFFVAVGGTVGFNSKSAYEQEEVITEPEGYGTFLDEDGNDTHSSVRNEFSGDIPESVSTHMHLLGRVYYELPLNKSGELLLVPRLTYYLPINEIVSNTSWKINTFNAGLAIKYAPMQTHEKEEVREKELRIDTIKVESDQIARMVIIPGKESSRIEVNETDELIINTEIITRIDTLKIPRDYKIAGKITALGVDSTGAEMSNPVFVIEEFIANRLDPLLNYIFFEENSAEIPGRYDLLSVSDASEFEPDSLYWVNTIEIYHNLLNIVARRMADYPEANITLVGCNSDTGPEKGALRLSERRAEAVKAYLTEVWKIAPGRISIEKRNLPELESTPTNEPEKIAENRRVEINSDDHRIIEPVFIKNIHRTSNPPVVRFKADIESEAGVKSWGISAWQESRADNKFRFTGTTDEINTADWVLEENQRITPQYNEPILYSLKVEDKKDNIREFEGEALDVEVVTLEHKKRERVGDYEIERFSLILFDFDKAIIEGSNERIIDFIQGRVNPDSEIEIAAYTDRTGEAAYNKELSERRARAAKEALGRKDADHKGMGEEILLYDNDLPEGRFYCRTVVITVKNKID